MVIFLHNEKRGFTLIELLAVIAIIGALASFIIAESNTFRQKARGVKTRTTIDQLDTAINRYYIDHSEFPPGEDDGIWGGGFDYNMVFSFIPQLSSEGYLPNITYNVQNIYDLYVYQYPNSTGYGLYRDSTCGTSPPASAVLFFWLESGISPDYKRSTFPPGGALSFPDGNAICYFK